MGGEELLPKNRGEARVEGETGRLIRRAVAADVSSGNELPLWGLGSPTEMGCQSLLGEVLQVLEP